jgi:hypothetical protein
MPSTDLTPPGLNSPMAWQFIPLPVADPSAAPPPFNEGTALPVNPPGLLSPMAWQSQPARGTPDTSAAPLAAGPLTALFP